MHRLLLKSSASTRISKGYPWVYRHAIANAPTHLEPGELVYLVNKKGRPFAIAYYNPLTQLAGRVLSYHPQETIDAAFFYQRFSQALHKRQRLFKDPFYRLVHAEGDHLPGLIIDRFGDTLVCQTNTAGMERLRPMWFEALKQLLQPTRVIFRDDIPLRQKEGLSLTVTAPLGSLEDTLCIQENGAQFFAHPSQGQKTGWYYDHRANRRWMSEQVNQKTVIDLYCFSGGFGICAALGGASAVTFVDGSQAALTLARQAAQANQILPLCQFEQADVFDYLEKMIQEGKTFDIVIADPPAFVKELRHKGAGLRGYYKLAKLTSQIVSPQGWLFIASCSHHASPNDFREAVEKGIAKAGRQPTLIRRSNADKDHPVHPMLPENHYLKALVYKLD